MRSFKRMFPTKIMPKNRGSKIRIAGWSNAGLIKPKNFFLYFYLILLCSFLCFMLPQDQKIPLDHLPPLILNHLQRLPKPATGLRQARLLAAEGNKKPKRR
jgi:hypothetical protein